MLLSCICLLYTLENSNCMSVSKERIHYLLEAYISKPGERAVESLGCAEFILQTQSEVQRELRGEPPVVLHVPGVVRRVRGEGVVGGDADGGRDAEHECRPAQAEVAGRRERVVVAAGIGGV